MTVQIIPSSVRRIWATIVVFVLVLAGAIGLASPASAFSYLCLSANNGFSCVSFSGYSGQSTWGYPVDSRGHNCTNYAAYRLAQNGAANPGNLGHASDWDSSARSKGFAVNSTPTIGSIAQWEPYVGAGTGATGHVGYVEVVGDGYIEVTDDNWGGTTSRKKYFSGQSDWPSNFLHIKDVQSAPPVSTVPAYVTYTDGSALRTKSGLGDNWITLTGATDNFQVAGNRFAYKSGRNLYVKDGVNSSWSHVSTFADDFRITESRIVVRDGTTLYGKDGLGDNWSQLTSISGPNFQIAGNRIAFLDGTTLYVKEGLGGAWSVLGSWVDDFRMTASRVVIRSGTTLLGKDGLGDSWSQLTAIAGTNFQIAGNRIAFLDGTTLYVKEGLGGAWSVLGSWVDDFRMTASRVVVRSSTTLYGKDGLSDSWSQLTAMSGTNFQAAGNRIAFVDGTTLYVKEGLDGAWSVLTGYANNFLLT